MKVTRAKGHLSEAEIDQRISKIKDYWRVRRWLIIRHALVDPSQATEIGKRFNVSKQMVSNLISNSIKFTNRNGNIYLKINQLNGIIELIIEDDGVGMKSEVVQNLFRLDVNYTSVGTEKEKGTGLGLILVKEFVEKNNGIISVESIENKGSKFILKFNL